MSGIFLRLQRSYVLLEEIFEFFVCVHLVDQLKYGLPVLVFQLLD
jgi:hypothetical protein